MDTQQDWQLTELQRRLDARLKVILAEARKAREDAWGDYSRAARALKSGRVPA